MNNKGKLWEIEAANYLRKHKYKLVDVNYTTRFGEIDVPEQCITHPLAVQHTPGHHRA